jgi:hypothetical protein
LDNFNRAKFAPGGAFVERLDSFLAGWQADVRAAVEVRNGTIDECVFREIGKLLSCQVCVTPRSTTFQGLSI